MRRALVTGSAGFVGYHLCRRLLADGWAVTGLDALTPYYDPRIKRHRHALLGAASNLFEPVEADMTAPGVLAGLVARARPDLVLHLAAQPGVRYSLENPRAYVEANVLGTLTLLEALRAAPPAHLLFASTSSVYGEPAPVPFREDAATGRPVSLYAATKLGAEALLHAWAHLFRLPVTVFRFFTVYGAWGRPDMAPWRFVEAVSEGRAIDVYGHGAPRRDYTFVADLAEAVLRLAERAPEGEGAPYRVVNVGGGRPHSVDELIAAVEAATGRRALRRELPMQPGDMAETFASPDELRRLTGFVPATPLGEGIAEVARWHREEWAPLREAWARG